MSITEILTVIATMIGGLALFLFGMNTMSNSLSSMTGGVLDRVLGVVTKKRFSAFLFGTGMTAIVQSSSAVSVLTVGLVNSGIIKLKQAIGLLIGGALGSTATAWILSLNALGGESVLMTITKPSFFAPFLGIIGVAMTMVAKKEKLKNIAFALLGFAVMMIGMNLMSQGVAPLKELPALQTALMSFSNPIIGFLFAALFTLLIQSSDATIGIVQAFALSVGVTFGMAIPLICGAQVGTCITALISSLGTSNNGKRTALVNLYYSLLKVIPFMILFYAANSFLHFSFLQESVGVIGIPLCHSLINVFGALIWLPGGDLIVKLSQKTIPFSEAEKRAQENVLTMLDENLLGNTAIALDQTDRAVTVMASTVGKASQLMTRLRPEDETEMEILFDRIRQYRDQLDTYITKLSARVSDTNDTAFVMLLTNANTAFGEIGVISRSIENTLTKLRKSGLPEEVTSKDRAELRVLGNAINEIIQFTIHGYETKDVKLSGMIQIYREEVLSISEIIKMRHIRLAHKEEGKRSATTRYTDVCYTQERLIDYCDIVADSLIKYNQTLGAKHPATFKDADALKKQIRTLFADKYEMIGIKVDENGHLIDVEE